MIGASGQYLLPNREGEPFLSIGFRLGERTDFVKDALDAIPLIDDEFVLEYVEEPISSPNPADCWVQGRISIRGKHDFLRTIADLYRWPWHSAG